MQRKYSLKDKRSFNYVYRRGLSVSNKQLVLLYAPSRMGLHIGFVVSKKVGKAVMRNKVKRRLKSIVQQHIMLFSNDYNYVFLARISAGECDYKTLEQSVLHLLTLSNKPPFKKEVV